MALKATLGDDGFAIFDAWSRGGVTYDPRAARATWTSVQTDGGITYGTLRYIAERHGYRVSASSQAHAHDALTAESRGIVDERATPDDDGRRSTRDSLVSEMSAEEPKNGHVSVASTAERIWSSAQESGTSGYLQRKKVLGHGVRFENDGTLVVPMRDVEARLWNLQMIEPVPPTIGPEKRFLKGGRKSGLMHWCGSPDGSPILLIAEGYATAASIHEATGKPVAVAFDAGGLIHVGRALRATFPEAVLAYCADDDSATKRRTGKNPGVDAAERAAKATGGIVIRPQGLPPDGTDFNDLARAVGQHAVRSIVDHAVRTAIKVNGSVAGDARTDPSTTVELDGTSPFEVDDEGVWFIAVDRRGRPLPPERVCARLDVLARTRDRSGL